MPPVPFASMKIVQGSAPSGKIKTIRVVGKVISESGSPKVTVVSKRGVQVGNPVYKTIKESDIDCARTSLEPKVQVSTAFATANYENVDSADGDAHAKVYSAVQDQSKAGSQIDSSPELLHSKNASRTVNFITKAPSQAVSQIDAPKEKITKPSLQPQQPVTQAETRNVTVKMESCDDDIQQLLSNPKNAAALIRYLQGCGKHS